MCMKTSLLFYIRHFCLFLFCASSLTQAQTVIITDIDDLKSTANAASPGDIIEIQNGTYDGNSMTITAKGTV